MPRKSRNGSKPSADNGFRFEWVQWSTTQLDDLRAWLRGNEDSLGATQRALCDSGWKLSISENQRTGRYLASITDKWGRKGCAGVAWGIEHSDLEAAIFGAYYYATEIIGDGLDEGMAGTVDDMW